MCVLGDKGSSTECVGASLHKEGVVVRPSPEEGKLLGCDLHVFEVLRNGLALAEYPDPDRHLGLGSDSGELQRDHGLGARIGELNRLNRVSGFAVEKTHRHEGHLLFDVDVDQRFRVRSDFVVVLT